MTQPRATDIGAAVGGGNPQRKGTEVQAALDALPSLLIIRLTLMGMESPDNRRKADGSYQTQGVGRGFFCPSFAQERQTMAGLPVSLIIAIWLVVTTWIVGAVAYWFEFGPEPVWLTLFLGASVALVEWRLFQEADDV